jgi:hypothetical protein
MKGAMLSCLALACLVSSRAALAQAHFDGDVWGPTVLGSVSLQRGFCTDCPSWLLAFFPDLSGLLIVHESNAVSALDNRYSISSDNQNLRSLISMVHDLDPSTPSAFQLNSQIMVIRCNPLGSLFIERTLTPADVALIRIRDLAEKIVREAKMNTLAGGS